eukprot:COSAG02_NODE_31485_length_532_cov_35.923788_1_plen_53_part_01
MYENHYEFINAENLLRWWKPHTNTRLPWLLLLLWLLLWLLWLPWLLWLSQYSS